jgi:hypothetical protein
MSDEVWTLGRWRVRPGREEEFVAAWRAVGAAFQALPQPPSGAGTLLRSVEDPALHYSFGPWPSLEAVAAMRATPAAVEAIDALRALCDEATPGAFTVVARG